MGIEYSKLFALLEQKGHSSNYWLRQNGIHPTTVSKLKNNKTVNSETIGNLCRLLDCQPGDLMEYVPDPKEEEG